jgi:hypothetical protein
MLNIFGKFGKNVFLCRGQNNEDMCQICAGPSFNGGKQLFNLIYRLQNGMPSWRVQGVGRGEGCDEEEGILLEGI